MPETEIVRVSRMREIRQSGLKRGEAVGNTVPPLLDRFNSGFSSPELADPHAPRVYRSGRPSDRLDLGQCPRVAPMIRFRLLAVLVLSLGLNTSTNAQESRRETGPWDVPALLKSADEAQQAVVGLARDSWRDTATELTGLLYERFLKAARVKSRTAPMTQALATVSSSKAMGKAPRRARKWAALAGVIRPRRSPTRRALATSSGQRPGTWA